MEKVTLYVKKILALGLSFLPYVILLPALFDIPADLLVLFNRGAAADIVSMNFLFLCFTLLLFAYLNYRITGDKPRFLFGLNQSDSFLNERGGFWNLFKWIVTLLGFLYDLVVWTLWGLFLIFILFAEILLLVKEIIYWLIHAFIWFVRQLFPPLVFIFRMIMHYLISWAWWIYQVAVNNVKTSINKNFYFIALWGTVPALFIVFLFYAISQVVGIPEIVAISAVFALIPIVWSFGEIAALRFEKREKDEYSSVQASFSNGFEAVRAVLFYLILIVILLVAEIVLNLLGWIPNLSMSLLGISLNLNMAISFVLVFLAVAIAFAGCILPTHILFNPEYDNDFDSSLGYLNTIGRKFLRYLFSTLPATLFGGILMIIPAMLMFVVFSISEPVKDKMLDIRIEQLSGKRQNMDAYEDYRTGIRIDRLDLYKDMPLMAPENFKKLAESSIRVKEIEQDIMRSQDNLSSRQVEYNKTYSKLSTAIKNIGSDGQGDTTTEQLSRLSEQRNDLEKDYILSVESLNESLAFLNQDLKELKRQRIQMPILYLFVGILISIFGGIVISVLIMYLGNVCYELYRLREDETPSYWVATLNEIRKKDPNQPLLGFTFLVLTSLLIMLLVSAAGFGILF